MEKGVLALRGSGTQNTLTPQDRLIHLFWHNINKFILGARPSMSPLLSLVSGAPAPPNPPSTRFGNDGSIKKVLKSLRVLDEFESLISKMKTFR